MNTKTNDILRITDRLDWLVTELTEHIDGGPYDDPEQESALRCARRSIELARLILGNLE